MSEQAIKELYESLIQHFKETNIKNALYYEPLFDYYWQQKDKIGICNLESYDNDIRGINKISAERILDFWSNAQTIKKSLKIFQAINWIITNGEYISEEKIKEFDNRNWEKSIDELGCGLYFNLRLSIGNQVKEDTSSIIDFYNDNFYIEYFKSFIKASELKMLIITGETGVKIINKIYPDLNLIWSDEMQAKLYKDVLFCPMQHPSRISYKKIADDLNYFFDIYYNKQGA